MASEIGLTFGAQTAAANSVIDACESLKDGLEAMTDDLGSHIDGVTNSGTSVLMDAMQQWSEAFGVFFSDLRSYASALAAVDATTRATEEQVTSSFANTDLASRMGG